VDGAYGNLPTMLLLPFLSPAHQSPDAHIVTNTNAQVNISLLPFLSPASQFPDDHIVMWSSGPHNHINNYQDPFFNYVLPFPDEHIVTNTNARVNTSLACIDGHVCSSSVNMTEDA